MLTFILRLLYVNGFLKKSTEGSYYCDPEILSISRICFRYIPIIEKRTDDIKKYCGDWHRITLIRWQIEYLTYITEKKVKSKIIFP